MKARQIEGEQIAALRSRERVQLVENDRIEIAEDIGRVGVAEQQRDLLGRGQEDVGRLQALARRAGDRLVSPERVSVRILRPISAIGAARLRAISVASAFKGET